MFFALFSFNQIVTAQTVIYDDSDASFSILASMVTVTPPNGGEGFYLDTMNTVVKYKSSVERTIIFIRNQIKTIEKIIEDKTYDKKRENW